jgi:hypothetical protein
MFGVDARDAEHGAGDRFLGPMDRAGLRAPSRRFKTLAVRQNFESSFVKHSRSLDVDVMNDALPPGATASERPTL